MSGKVLAWFGMKHYHLLLGFNLNISSYISEKRIGGKEFLFAIISDMVLLRFFRFLLSDSLRFFNLRLLSALILITSINYKKQGGFLAKMG